METIVCEETEMNRVSEEGNGGSGKNIAIKLGMKKSREHFYIIFVNLKFEISCFLADVQVEEYYPTFLNMAKNLMEGTVCPYVYI